MAKFKLKNNFITEKGEFHPKGSVVELNEREARVGFDFRAIEPIQEVNQPVPNKASDTAKTEAADLKEKVEEPKNPTTETDSPKDPDTTPSK